MPPGRIGPELVHGGFARKVRYVEGIEVLTTLAVPVEIIQIVKIGREKVAVSAHRRTQRLLVSLRSQPSQPAVPEVKHHIIARHQTHVCGRRLDLNIRIVSQKDAGRRVSVEQRIGIGQPALVSAEDCGGRHHGGPLLDRDIHAVVDTTVVATTINPRSLGVPNAVVGHRRIPTR